MFWLRFIKRRIWGSHQTRCEEFFSTFVYRLGELGPFSFSLAMISTWGTLLEQGFFFFFPF